MERGAIGWTLHTLGPDGTNCARAAHHWLQTVARKTTSSETTSPPAPETGPGSVVLHPTLEEACTFLRDPKSDRLLSCAAYPELHTLIFSHLDRMRLIDSFILPTHSMVLAARDPSEPIATIATHPAPQYLAARSQDDSRQRILPANSNAEAARRCAGGDADACITTDVAAGHHGLRIRHVYGPVTMAFLVHAPT